MNKFRLILNVLAFAIFTFAFASMAQAQASRTWVSGVGDDANPCSRTAPCKTFAGAISKTATGGEINCLDPGGFGAVTITKSISIICGEIGTAGVLVSGTNGIIVNTPSAGDRVLLEGLDIEGLGTGLSGVQILTGRVTIRKCSIRNFRGSPGNGVNLVATNAGSRAYIMDSQILSNNGGVNVSGPGNFATLIDSIVDSNLAFAVQVTDAVNKITLRSSSLTGSPAAINAVTGGQVVSVGTSNFLAGTGVPTSTVPLQ